MEYIKALQDAILKTHGCKARHIRSEPVNEQYEGKTIWQGIVEVFELIDYSKAKLCYAWGHNIEDRTAKSRYVTVLGIPPILNALDAVRASIISDSKHKTDK